MERKNTVWWSDIETTNRLMANLTEAMFKYQKYALDPDNAGYLHGDMNVIVQAISLHKKLGEMIEKSAKANTRV